MNMRAIILTIVVCLASAAQVSAGGPLSAPGLFPPPPSTWHRATPPTPEPPVTPQKLALLKFINDNLPPSWIKVPSPICVGQSGWINVGGGKRGFAVLIDWSERGLFNELDIYDRNGSRGSMIQTIHGWLLGERNGDLSNIARDLNGDGKDELIISQSLAPRGVWQPMAGMPTWPAVYRFENRKYVEDSRDFPNYYDTEVLPQLDAAIAKAQGYGQTDEVAADMLEKNKILRVLGRNPVAGLNHAYQWMNSDDPTLMQCAIATFADIGGHEKEVRELRQALPAAVTHEIETRKGG